MKKSFAAVLIGLSAWLAPVAAPQAAPDRSPIEIALDTYLAPGGDALILLPHKLDRSRLDFSMQSLGAIDDWLQAIHTINVIEAGEGRAGDAFTRDGRGDNSVVFAGLYLGEVVRRNARQAWVWQGYDAFVAANPVHGAALGADPGLDAYVLVSGQGVATPINSALKRVLFGPIDSVAYIGAFLSEPVDLDRAMAGPDLSGLPDPRG